VSYSNDPRLPDDDGDAFARRVLLLFAFSLVAVGLGGLVFVTVNRESFDDTGTVADSAVVTGIGPQPGVDLAGYANERAAALADAGGERLAVVSFTDYVSETQARAMVGQVKVVSLLAAVPGGLPDVVNGSLADWVNGQVAEQRKERDEIRSLLPTVDDPQFAAFYQEEIARLDALLEGVDANGALVFAAVVKGSAADLKALSTTPGVRLVDVAASSKMSGDAPVGGLRPEETVTANDPATRPV